VCRRCSAARAALRQEQTAKTLGAPNRGLLDGIAESPSVVSDPCVARHDRGELWWFIEQLCGGQVHRVERPNGFHRKWPTDASEDNAIDVNDEASAFECPQSSNGGLFLGDGQPASDTCADDGAGGFCKRQGGRHVPPVSLERRQRGSVMFQQSSKQRARLDVPKACDRDPDLWDLGGGFADRPAPLRATLRHGRCRSSPRPCHAAAGYPASPPRGRQLRPADELRRSQRARRIDFAAQSWSRTPEEPALRQHAHVPSPKSARLPRFGGCSGSGCPSALGFRFP